MNDYVSCNCIPTKTPQNAGDCYDPTKRKATITDKKLVKCALCRYIKTIIT